MHLDGTVTFGHRPGEAARLDDACVQCARLMASTALDRMERLHGMRVCPKCAPKKARKTFNAAAVRANAFDGARAGSSSDLARNRRHVPNQWNAFKLAF